jgi:hypothetical protein
MKKANYLDVYGKPAAAKTDAAGRHTSTRTSCRFFGSLCTETLRALSPVRLPQIRYSVRNGRPLTRTIAVPVMDFLDTHLGFTCQQRALYGNLTKPSPHVALPLATRADLFADIGFIRPSNTIDGCAKLQTPWRSWHRIIRCLSPNLMY